MRMTTDRFHDKIKKNKDVWVTQNTDDAAVDNDKSFSFFLILIFTFLISYLIFANTIF